MQLGSYDDPDIIDVVDGAFIVGDADLGFGHRIQLGLLYRIVNQTVPAVSLTTNSPVALTATGDYGNGVKVTLAAIEAVTTTAELPGEIAGPGVKVTVDVVNDSNAAVDLGNVIVDLEDAAGTPAIPMSASPASPFTGSVAAGATATGIYVFTVPTTYSNPATISVSYSTEVPVVVFVGDAK
jgi:hypothetical protein